MAALKEDLQCSPAQLVYGEPLRLPGELLHCPFSPSRSRRGLNQLRHPTPPAEGTTGPTPASRHGQQPVFVSKDLLTATHVFLRDDTVRPSLKPPYSGPHKKVDALSRSHAGSRSRSSSRSRPRSASRHRKSGACWYHAKFGTKAAKYLTPCTWKPDQTGNALNNQ
ncbi:unnamed protein product, partial [Iphiclides podalirius]